MNLRSGKRYQPKFVSSQNITYEIIHENDFDYDYDNWSKSISYLITNIVNYSVQINRNYENQQNNLTEKERCNEIVRVFREIYYLVDYYDIKTIPKLQKFILALKKKAESSIIELNEILNRNGNTKGFRLTGKDKESAEYLIKELNDFLQSF